MASSEKSGFGIRGKELAMFMNRGGKHRNTTAAYTEILPPADRILVQTRHTDAIKARAACATVGESPEPSPSRQPCLEGLAPHCARGSRSFGKGIARKRVGRDAERTTKKTDAERDVSDSVSTHTPTRAAPERFSRWEETQVL